MNRQIQNILSLMYPFFPFLAWIAHFAGDKPVTFYFNILALPLAIYFLVSSKRKLPAYLICFMLFVFYHLASSFINHTIPDNQNPAFFILYDYNVFAFAMFVVIENTDFDVAFIEKMNRNIFYIIVISLLVSILQMQNPNFFFNPRVLMDNPEEFGEVEIRNASIYSWYTANSGGITFPILISFALNYFEAQKSRFMFIVLAGILVSFLTKARYVMISAILVFSQLFISKGKSFTKLISLAFIFAAGIALFVFIADQVGYDLQKVISSRILEEDSDMESAKARVVSYEVFMKVFPQHPWLGVGPATGKDVVELLGGGIPLIHVGYLSYLYFYGLVGCLFLFLSLFFLLRDGWRVGKKWGFWGSFYGLITFCVANATFVYFNFAEMGIVLCVIYQRFYKTYEPEESELEDTPATTS
ncbi:MAG TPA: O-antigen ligase family protein [Chitinophagaceae bacterium]|nr:O-antigen ligase family protein [Chitinophagaceae bacterium]HPH30270.1 O-antigen ligase family protein [Chitinophagaceae bacterium]HPN57756.1 O-antigen ligase family protein [Chitinophagaceae bacterium]